MLFGKGVRMSETAPEPAPDGAFLKAPPPFFSLAFHVSFLPRVVAFRFGQWRRERNVRRHVHIEIPLLIFGCLILAALGLPAALKGSIAGWASTLIGAGALVALLVWSIVGEYRARREEGYRYDYAVFMPSVFCFFVLAGFTAGLIAGGLIHDSLAVGMLWAAPGLVIGYLAGLFAARWVHALGFLAEWFVYLAILGLIFLPIEDLMVIFIFAGKGDR
ncbi:MAG TPA: hypothetical protein VGS58_19505 [Candidatus Sulfopaludibacter sp.]|nr:hypothetical protein [Candidatus Sulfopaludibacter sp.]